MGYKWRVLKIPRFFGLDLKTNVVDVKDGFSLALQNVYQGSDGLASKRPGNEIMFDADEAAASQIDSVGSATLAGTKYYFKFVDGVFKHSLTKTGAQTTISPSPAIDTAHNVFWAVLDDKLFFVDGVNNLRFFNGTTIRDSSIYVRPTVALTSASGAGGFTYVYTVDNGLGESPVVSSLLTSIVSAATVRVTGNTGPQTLVAGDVVRIYSRADTIAAASKLVATYTWQAADVAAGFKDVATVAISDTQPQLYSELGIALNKTAPTALTGITTHYGRLVGWKGSRVYNSKVTNPHSWPDDSAQREAFVYGFGLGDGEDIQTCISYLESLYVMKKTNIAVFGGIGPDDTGNNAYSFRRLETNGNGCSAPKSAAVIGENSQSYLVYMSQQGFFATNGSNPIRIGENIETQIYGLSSAIQATSVAFHHKRLGVYICFTGTSTNRIAWVLDVRKDQGEMVGWFKWTDVHVKSVFWDEDRFIFGTYTGYCGSERIAGTSVDFSDVKHEYIATTAIDTTTEIITVTQSYATGDAVVVRTNGTIPAGLTANTTYYVIRVSATQIKLATSAANALAGTAINITSQGVGTHSIVGSKAIDAFYSMNWLNFGTPSYVKKLAKPSIILNALANSVNITMTCAYDYVESFQDSRTISVGSSHAWGTLPWGTFVWGLGATASPRNVAIARRKVRAVRYKFANNVINQDFNLQGIEQPYDIIRNRGNFA